MQILKKEVKQLARDLKQELLERFKTNDYVEFALVQDRDKTFGYCETSNLDEMVYEGYKYINTLKKYRADDEKITIKNLEEELINLIED